MKRVISKFSKPSGTKIQGGILIFGRNKMQDCSNVQNIGICTIGTPEHVLEICDYALAMAGYTVLDGDDDCIFIKHENKSFEVKIIECVD
jgi:hypothetical protein